MTNLSEQYRETMELYRYYINTDDYCSWKRETKEREATRRKLEELTKQFEALGQEPPYIR